MKVKQTKRYHLVFECAFDNEDKKTYERLIITDDMDRDSALMFAGMLAGAMNHGREIDVDSFRVISFTEITKEQASEIALKLNNGLPSLSFDFSNES